MRSISIIICSFNPNYKTFGRLLNAILNIDYPKEKFEVLIIDNNSILPLSKLDYVKIFLKLQKNARIILENEKGLTNARIKGIENSKFDYLLFFDDDNDPDVNYLKSLNHLIDSHSKVGVWGAGIIRVEFLKTQQPSWLDEFKDQFQERNLSHTLFGNVNEWKWFYPFGTGMAIRKDMAVDYCQKVKLKQYTMLDRNGNNLSSGGDIQMVLNTIKNGYLAASSPDLFLNHIIDLRKSTFRYLCRHSFYVSKASYSLHYEVFPEKFNSIDLPSNMKIIKTIYYYFFINTLRNSFRKKIVQLFSFFGYMSGLLTLDAKCRAPLLYRILTPFLKLYITI